MSDFSTKYITQYETIGDSGSSDYNLNFDLNSLHQPVDRNVRTNILIKAIICGMDLALLIILLPFTTCQKIYGNDHLMVMLRVIFEVSLELVMWLVLAGVSILTSAALIFDDLYCGKSGSESYRRLVKNCGSSCSHREDESQHPTGERQNNESPPRKNEWAKETLQEGLRDAENHGHRLSMTSSISARKKIMGNGTEKSDVKKTEDEGSVNFSFYKPLHRGPGVTENLKSDKESLSQRF